MIPMLKQAVAATAAPMKRRTFLKVAGGASAGLIVGFGAGGSALARGDGGFNPFVRISPEGLVTVISKHLDKGQGTLSGLAVLVAEELDADWAQMRGEFAPADRKIYNNLHWGPYQGTGGSSGIPNSYEQYRQAGAAARAMLVQAAARKWGVDAGRITVAKGLVAHPSGKSATLGELAEAASAEKPPAKAKLKDPAAFKLIGNPDVGRLDTGAKSTGQAIYTQDIDRPGMQYAVLARSPRFGGKVRAFDDRAARATPGVVDVVQVPQGVAVLATGTWAAISGREALEIDWDDSQAETRSTDAILKEYRALAEKPGLVAVDNGDVEGALAGAAKVLEATYVFPYLAHAPMEPMNAVVELQPGRSVEIWTGSQGQSFDQANVAAALGIQPEMVKINTLFAGGSFGRRTTANSDYLIEAVEIAKAIGGRAPVKLVWTREDDIQGGYYRPMYVHKLRAGIDGDGAIVGWSHRIVGQSIVAGTAFEAFLVKDGVDHTTIEGAAALPYDVGAQRLEATSTPSGVPVLWWRSVGSTHTAYAVETMMDMLADAAGMDPVAFRLKAMTKTPREAAVLRLAAEKAGWDKPAPAGVHRGVAVHKSFNSYVAQVADVRIDGDGLVKVEAVECAIDCGVAVMPDQIKAQMEGSIGYGLGAVMRNKVTMTDGVVDQFNFTDYEPTRMSDMPRVAVHVMPSAVAPTGAGEPGVPPIGPAVANALFAAKGVMVTELPMTDSGIEFA